MKLNGGLVSHATTKHVKNMKAVTAYINRKEKTITVVEVVGIVNKKSTEQIYRIGNGRWAYSIDTTIEFLKGMHKNIEFLNV